MVHHYVLTSSLCFFFCSRFHGLYISPGRDGDHAYLDDPLGTSVDSDPRELSAMVADVADDSEPEM